MPIPEGLIPRGPTPVTYRVLAKIMDCLRALANGCDVIASLPNPNQHNLDVRVQRLFYRTGVGGADESLAQIFGDTRGHMNRRLQLRDATRRLGGHVFLDVDAQAAEIQLEPLGLDAEDRHDAGRERSRGEVGRRERLTLAMIINGRVGMQHGTGGTVRGFDAQIAEVFAGDFYAHGR